MPKGLPFRLTDYLALVDWAGRILRDDKKGTIAENIPPIPRSQSCNVDQPIAEAHTCLRILNIGFSDVLTSVF